ncbi:MAG: hypothetical protein LBF79_03800 [Dysgonamonadaceae bacterium]|jgi:hypothetical protein|nr:hypothetical protein [Dysgonamonadaceae bacterium]
MGMVLIFYPFGDSGRLSYAAGHIFGSLSGVEFEVTGDRARFVSHVGVAIDYSPEGIGHGFRVVPSGLLEGRGYSVVNDLREGGWEGMYCIFFSGVGDIPFDIFSAVFYFLTSYEEYFSDDLDGHGRYDMFVSLAFRRGFLDIPLVDRWAVTFREELSRRFPLFEFRPREYRFVVTFDVDFPYRYRHRGFMRNVRSFAGNFLRGDYGGIRDHFGVLLGLSEDPYLEVLRRIETDVRRAGLRYLLFILLGGGDDVGHSGGCLGGDFLKFVSLLERDCVGLHPSYGSYGDLSCLVGEKSGLEAILDCGSIVRCRRHFLRYTCPGSFREAFSAGFTDDYTLAFAGSPGYRSGTSVPYRFYDVERDILTGLTIHPTVMMDTTLICHLGLGPDAAFDVISGLAGASRAVGGDFTCLWHNSNLAGRGNRWYEVFARSLRELQ